MYQDRQNIAADPAADASDRKPRIALMGEFSAGKSTLSNLLIGAASLPTKVTATQLPPVWIAYGDAPPFRVDLEGCEHPVDLEDLSAISTSDTQFIRVFHKTDALELCDLIDMPGISDPNMPPEVWERVAHHADGVIWCTHATQAWRQSEAAVWADFSDQLADKSLLLLTRFDKITGDRDRQRVVRRVEKETQGLFRGVFPISLTQALAAGEDLQKWQDSGADGFATALIALAQELSRPAASRFAGGHTADTEIAAAPAPEAPGDAAGGNVQVLAKARDIETVAPPVGAVSPRRIAGTRPAAARKPRPPSDNSGSPLT